jgi:hypothetical protein
MATAFASLEIRPVAVTPEHLTAACRATFNVAPRNMVLTLNHHAVMTGTLVCAPVLFFVAVADARKFNAVGMARGFELSLPNSIRPVR